MDYQSLLSKFQNWAIEFAPKIVVALLTLAIGLWLIKKLEKLLIKSLKKREMDVSLQSFLKSLVSIGLKVVLFISVAGMLGFQSSSLVAILGAAGLAVGLALQGSLSNFAGGVLILIFKPFKVGDLIEAQGFTGEVVEIQIFNTILLTADRKTIIVPNGALSNGSIVNYSKKGEIRVDLSLKVDAGNDINKLKKELLTIVLNNDKVLKNPEPFVGIIGMIEGGYEITIRPYSTVTNYWEVYFEINQEIVHYVQNNKIEGPKITRIINSN
jgi:small conductance mechanosensitive channel